jgi:hypothetical protein
MEDALLRIAPIERNMQNDHPIREKSLSANMRLPTWTLLEVCRSAALTPAWRRPFRSGFDEF